MNENRGDTFERRIMPILKYIGIIGASLMSVVYMLIVTILVIGFQADYRRNWTDTIVFASINAAVGLIIMFFLKYQGTIFARNRPENKLILDKYNTRKTKERKYHSIKFYWVTTTIKDIIIKGVSIGVSSFGIIYIVIQGTNDFTMMLLAIVNLVMFISFGLLAMNSAYTFYNENHIPYLEHVMDIETQTKREVHDKNHEKKEVESCLNSETKNLEI